MGFHDHFSGQSRRHTAYRPTCPQALAGFPADTAPGREPVPEFRHVIAFWGDVLLQTRDARRFAWIRGFVVCCRPVSAAYE